MGTNMLLRDGAGVVITAADVLEPLGIAPAEGTGGTPAEPDSETGKAIMKELSVGTLHFDQLLRSLGVGTAVLQSELLALEMSGLVLQHPGKYYSLRRIIPQA
jgi:DNA processing protein